MPEKSKVEIVFPEGTESHEDEMIIAVIAARFGGKWVFVRDRERTTWEICGGHREKGESIEQTARRELWEETGAEEFRLYPVAPYCCIIDGKENYAMLFYAEIAKLGELPPDFETGELMFSDTLPENLTYPEIQPPLFERASQWLSRNGSLSVS